MSRDPVERLADLQIKAAEIRDAAVAATEPSGKQGEGQ